MGSAIHKPLWSVVISRTGGYHLHLTPVLGHLLGGRFVFAVEYLLVNVLTGPMTIPDTHLLFTCSPSKPVAPM